MSATERPPRSETLLRAGSLRKKLRLINLLTTGSAFLIAVLLLAVHDYFELRSTFIERKPAPRPSSSAATAPRRWCSTIRWRPKASCAPFRRPPGALRRPVERHRPAPRHLHPGRHGTAPVTAQAPAAGYLPQPVGAGCHPADPVDGAQAGAVTLRFDLGKLYLRLMWHIIAFAVVILIALAIAHGLLARLQPDHHRPMTRPRT